MNKKIYEKIKRKYGRWASFAVWDKSDIENLEPIHNSVSQLKNSVIILGLNASRKAKKDFGSFHYKHGGGRDDFLMEAFNHSPFRGAYMTDIVKEVNSKSKKITEKLKNKPKKYSTEFKEELQDLKCKNPLIIAIGKDVEKFLKESKKIKNSRIIGIPHYADRYRITKKRFISAVKKVEKSQKNAKRVRKKEGEK